jgi:hypothetical protein
MSGWLGSIIAAIVKALLGAFFERKDAVQQRQDDRTAGAKDAATETDQTTKDIADARAIIAARPDSPADLAARLRAKADRAAGGGGPKSN